MSTVQRIEYHKNCPNCGAPGNDLEVCAYCGSSLVKERVAFESELSAEDIIAREDAGLPVCRVKSGEVTPFLKMFCPLFGGIFLAVPTIMFAAFSAAGALEPWLIGFFSVFWVIGAGALIPLFAAVSARNKCRKGNAMQGIVRGYERTNMRINDEVVQAVRLRIDDGSPRIIVLSTGDTKRPYPLDTRLTLRTDGKHYLIEKPA